MAFGEISNYYDVRKLENNDYFQYLHYKLTEDKWYKPLLDYSEEVFKWNRVYTVIGIIIIFLTLHKYMNKYLLIFILKCVIIAVGILGKCVVIHTLNSFCF